MMRTIRYLGSPITVALAVLWSGAAMLAQTPAPPLLMQILQAHKAWPNTPQSIQITGKSTHDGVAEPVTITATRQEEVLIAYGQDGSRTQVATSSLFFKEDGSKTEYLSTPAGFSQLDLTGVFLLSELRSRPVRLGAARQATLLGAPASVIHVVNDTRSQRHYGRIRVADELDLFINTSGLLGGISRTFYKDNPPFTATQAYAFSDYRDTGGMLLPYRIDRYINGKQIESIAVTIYAFDVAIPAEAFAPAEQRRTK